MKSNIGCISTTIDDNARASKAARHTRSLPRLVPRPLRVSAAVTEKSVAPANIPFFSFLFFFFQGGLSFPLLLLRDGGSRAATRRNDPILVHENAIIPVNRLSKRTEKGDGEKREREKNKNQSSPSTGSTTLPFDEVRGNTFECTHACIHVRTRICTRNRGERGGFGERETEEERERESLYPPRFETSLRQAGLLDSTEDSRYSYPPFSAVPPSPGRE